MKWDLSSLTDRWPSYYREGSAWLLAPLDTQHCVGPAPGHISDPVASQSGGPHWQPQVVTALASWCGVALADKGEQGSVLFPVAAVCKEETSRPGWLWNNKMAAPIISALASSLFSGWTRPWERNVGLLRLHTLLNMSFCTYYMHQEQISQAFFSCETRLVIRVNYSVVRGNIMMEKN